MTRTNKDNTGGTKPAKGPRNERLSKDGKWRSFPKVPNLLQYVSTGTFYGKVKVDGKVFRESLGTTVFSTAKLKLGDFIKVKLRKKRLIGAPDTFAEARILYEQDLADEHTLSENSKRYRRYCIKKLTESWPELDGMRLNHVSESDCRQWAGRFATQVDERYFNNVLGTLRGIFKRAGMVGTDDPSRGIERLGVKPNDLKLPEPEEFEKMLSLIETSGAGQAQHCADLVRFLAFSGCRISEARKVRWADVDTEREVITVQNAKTRRANDAALTRYVPIIPPMKSLLKRLAEEPHAAEDAVCKIGECQNSMTRACRLLDIPRITHHDLRHLFASVCIESGVDIPTVSRWLGHKDGGALAMRVYGHLRDQHGTAMAAKVTFSPAKEEPKKEQKPGTESKKWVRKSDSILCRLSVVCPTPHSGSLA